MNNITTTIDQSSKLEEVSLQQPTIKYRAKIERAICDINSELKKALLASSTVKNILGFEQDITHINKKILELKKALQDPNEVPKFSSPHSAKIYSTLDRLVDIANKDKISPQDQEILLKELKENINDSSNYVSSVKNAIQKSDEGNLFKF